MGELYEGPVVITAGTKYPEIMAARVRIEQVDSGSATLLAHFAQQQPLAYSEFAWSAEHIEQSPPVWVARRGDQILAVAIGEGLSRAVAGDPDALRLLAQHQPDSADRLVLYGRRAEVEAYAEHVDGERWWWPQQLMSLGRGQLQGTVEQLPLRTATLDDVGLVARSRMITWADENRMSIQPYSQMDSDIIETVHQAVVAQRLVVWVEDGTLAFTAEIGAQTPTATIFYSLFTDPALRGRGYATRALTSWCDWLLKSSEHVLLRVGMDNHPATRLYERVGFRTVDETAHSIRVLAA